VFYEAQRLFLTTDPKIIQEFQPALQDSTPRVPPFLQSDERVGSPVQTTMNTVKMMLTSAQAE
jgi:hypothetical protein